MKEWLIIHTAPLDETTVDLWVVNETVKTSFRIPGAWYCRAAIDWFTSDANYSQPGPCLGPGDHATHWMPSPVRPAPNNDLNIGNSGIIDKAIFERAKAHVEAMAIVSADPVEALKRLA